MDSSALAVLVTVRARLAGRGGQVVVAGCGDDLRRRFRVSGLDTLFLMTDSREQALNVVREQAS
jgi:anti-anti-sigma factor